MSPSAAPRQGLHASRVQCPIEVKLKVHEEIRQSGNQVASFVRRVDIYYSGYDTSCFFFMRLSISRNAFMLGSSPAMTASTSLSA